VPCSCCAGEALDIFSEKGARRELRRYLRNGLGGDDAKLIASWAEEGGLEGATVLEVGGGIGQVQTELLRRGAAGGTVAEVVAGYGEAAAELARAAEVSERTSFVLADLLETPEAVEPADIVVLRRVVCCSPRGPELLGIAAGRARRTLLASYPRNRASNRFFARLQNAFFGLIRKRVRVFIHPPAELEREAARYGLRRTRVSQGTIWETAQFDAVF
jgi:magnesium-protoporphyrin O-methyltransferase